MNAMSLLRRVGIAALFASLCVAPSALGSSATMSATPTTVGGVASVSATAGLPAGTAAGGAEQVVTQAFDPTFLRLGSASQVTAPEGWALSYSTNGSAFGEAPTTASGWAAVRAVRATGTVTGDAATGGSVSASVATPASSAFSAGGGGDGWNVFFDDHGHVFNIWHHNGSAAIGAIDCHTRTGASCGPGWPFYMSAAGTNGGSASRVLNTPEHSDGWVDPITRRLWFAVNDNGTTSNTGIACVDVSDLTTGPSWCGGSHTAAFKVLGTTNRNSYAAGRFCKATVEYGCVDGLAVAGRRVYTVETRTGNVLCLDAAANGGLGAACSGQPYAFAGANAAPTINTGDLASAGSWQPALVNYDGRIYGTALGSWTGTGAQSGTLADMATAVGFCFLGGTGAPCPGWSSTARAMPASTWFVYAEPDANGDTSAVCFRAMRRASTNTPSCFDSAGNAVTGNSAVAGTFRLGTESEIASGSAITVGTRVVWGQGVWNTTSPIYCFDVAIGADCAGWSSVIGGSKYNYVVTVDPDNENCFWSNSHQGQILQTDVTGGSTCTTVPGRALFIPTSLGSSERLSCTSAGSWGTFSLTSPGAGTYSTATLTVLTASGAVVTSGGVTWRNVPIGADRTVNLSGLSKADTGSNPQFVVNLTGRTNGDPIATTISAPAQAPQLCTTLTSQEVACPIKGAPTGSLFGWTSPVTASGRQGSTSLTDAASSVAFSNAASQKCPATNLTVTVIPLRKRLVPGGTSRVAVKTCNIGEKASTSTKSTLQIPNGMTVVNKGGGEGCPPEGAGDRARKDHHGEAPGGHLEPRHGSAREVRDALHHASGELPRRGGPAGHCQVERGAHRAWPRGHSRGAAGGRRLALGFGGMPGSRLRAWHPRGPRAAGVSPGDQRRC